MKTKTTNCKSQFKILLILFIFLLFSNVTFSQGNDWCGTGNNSYDPSYTNQLKSLVTNDDLHLKLYLHIIRRSDGTDGISEDKVQTSFDLLNSDFNQFNVYFHADLDCGNLEIDYIDNDAYFNYGTENIFTVNNHDDGIDIYYFRPFSGAIVGQANGYGVSSELWVGGSVNLSPPYGQYIDVLGSNYWGATRTVCHEMGHVFSLWHTHKGSPLIDADDGCAEVVWVGSNPINQPNNLENCEECGDEICDTPADPNLGYGFGLVDIETCEYTGGSPIQINGYPYDWYNQAPWNLDEPQTNNIMSYTKPNCRNIFTVGQQNRMRSAIETLPFLQQCIIPTDISENTTISTNITMFTDLTVYAGAILTITSELSFAQDAKLIIEPGAKVILDGGTLTALCDYWPGVEVQGNSNQIQNSPTYSNQGWFRTQGDALIEKALIGADVKSGGVISSWNTTYLNNGLDVHFDSFQNYVGFNVPAYNKSDFGKCHFLVNDQVINQVNLWSRVQLNMVDGILFKGCEFGIEGNALNIYDYDQRGMGILSASGGYRVIEHCYGGQQQDGTCNGTLTPSTFNNLKYGIYSFSGNLLKTFKVKNAVFNHNQYGIHAVNVDNLSIIDNEFIVNPVSPGIISSGYYYGVYLRGCNGYEVEENEFHTIGGNYRTMGIAVRDSDDDPNRIYYNEFHDLHVGSSTQGDNQVDGNFLEGLQLLCGQYENNSYDISCINNSKIAFFQGSNVGNVADKYSPSNHFLTNVYNCPNNKMINLSPNSQLFNYYYKSGEHPFNDPNTFSCWNQSINANPLTDAFGIQLVFQGRDEECLSGLTYGGNTKDEKKLKVIEKRVAVNAISSSVVQLEDGGNSGNLMAIVTNANTNSYGVRNGLIDACPYLSDDILIALINRIPEMGQWDLAELLINNSPLSLPVLSAYYQQEPLTPFYHTILLNYQDGESTLLSLKRDIKDHRAIKGDVQSDFIRMMTVEMEEIPDLYEIKDLLEQDVTNSAIRVKHSIAIQEGDDVLAQNLLAGYTPTTDDDAWVEFQELMAEINLSGDLQNLTSSQIAEFESFIANDKKETHIAKAFLWFATGVEYVEDLEFPDDNKSLLSQTDKTLPTVAMPELNVFPNPATNEVFFTFDLPVDMKNTIIRIYSTEGKMVYEDDLTGRKGMYRVDISTLAVGNYLAEVLVDGIQIMNTKFVKK